jgi:hypothetical protein
MAGTTTKNETEQLLLTGLLRSRGRIANPRSIGSSEKNHGLRFEGILEIDLQGNRPSKGQNPANSITCARPVISPFNSF